MCLLAFSWNTHPRYRLIFAGNRDEFHARPTAPAAWWQDMPDVFGGRDLEAGGSWLGLRRDGRFAVVTNFREPDRRPPGKRSRGALITEFLGSDRSAESWHEQLERQLDDYAGFNLIFGDLGQSLYYCSNRVPQAPAPMPYRHIEPGVHALSNHLLNTPWPKVRRLRERFAAEAMRPEPGAARLLEFLDDVEPAPEHALPDTGLSMEWERLLSSARIVGPGYGTRSSTVILVGHDGSAAFYERRFDANGQVAGDTLQRFEPP